MKLTTQMSNEKKYGFSELIVYVVPNTHYMKNLLKYSKHPHKKNIRFRSSLRLIKFLFTGCLVRNQQN